MDGGERGNINSGGSGGIVGSCADANDTLTPLESEENKDLNDFKRYCTSLPLYYDRIRSELCTLGSRPGMECIPLRSPPGPYHYHVTDQTKSLQELQNEVGALLEFRDLVIETFPDLKHKMASISTSNTIMEAPSSSSMASRREWEPGIRLRRKLTQKEAHDISSSLVRSRSNSHSGKKEPKSGEGNGSVIQDSGFSTETSSSKETHSASSTTGTVQGVNVMNPANRFTMDAEDELWNLLDVIHRKSTRLREEVEQLHSFEKDKFKSSTSSSNNNNNNNSNSNNNINNSSIPVLFQHHLNRFSKSDLQILRKERDHLLDKLSDMETETIADRINRNKMQDEIEQLLKIKYELEEQLRSALNQKIELNTRIHDMHQQFVNKSGPNSPETNKIRPHLIPIGGGHRKLSITDSVNSTNIIQPTNVIIGNRLSTTFTPIGKSPITYTIKNVPHNNNGNNELNINRDITKSNTTIGELNDDNIIIDTKQLKNEINLGHLDGLVSSPNRCSKVRVADSKKIAAILLETNIVELQRHLLTLTVQNQVLTQRLEQATKSKIVIIKRYDKAKEDIDDLKFQLEEKNIELEGTKAQLRVLEKTIQPPYQSSTIGGVSTIATTPIITTTTNKNPKPTTNKSDFSPEHICSSASSTILLHSSTSPAASTLASPTASSSSASSASSSSRDILHMIQSSSQISTPSMKAMIPLAMDEIQQHSSSTESAQDQNEHDINKQLYNMGLTMSTTMTTSTTTSTISSGPPDTPKRRPSKIPLPGASTKGYFAPKPPTGRHQPSSSSSSTNSPVTPTNTSSQSNRLLSNNYQSGPSSNKSLSKSTSSLISGRSSNGPNSIQKKEHSANNSPSLNRPDSALSYRKDSSFNSNMGGTAGNGNSKNSQSSIPISLKNSPTNGNGISASPILTHKQKRESLTSKVRNMDSLSRMQQQSTSSSALLNSNLNLSTASKSTTSSFTSTTSSTTIMSSSANARKQSNNSGPLRRPSSSSSIISSSTNSSIGNGRSNNNGNGNISNFSTYSGGSGVGGMIGTYHHHHHHLATSSNNSNNHNNNNNEPDNGKVLNFRTRIMNMFKS